MVKGENSTQLIEQFTAEMTLVAEGLCEDQSKLHQDVEQMMREDDRRIQKLEARLQVLETALEEEQAARDRDLTESRNRLAALEKSVAKETPKEPARKEKRSGTLLRSAIILVSIGAGAWVLVTLLNLIRDVLMK
jgi:Flp pilus assembly protein TadB